MTERVDPKNATDPRNKNQKKGKLGSSMVSENPKDKEEVKTSSLTFD